MTRQPAPQPASGPLSKPGAVLLTFFSLVTFTQSQSLYEMLAGNTEMLALRLRGNGQLLEIVLAFNWLPALALFALWWVLNRLHPSAGRIFLGLACFLLFVLFCFQLDNAYFLDMGHGFSRSYWLWVLPSLALSLALLRFQKAFLAFVIALSPGIVFFPLLFLSRTWADTSAYVPASVSAAERTPPAESLPSIVILVLDEFSLPAIVDEAGRIDADRFPQFHALAQQSHWFRNATANADHTTRSIPALLTGNLPLPVGSPTFRNYPENLFTWLQPHYQIYVWETWTRFCVPLVFHCMATLHEHTANRGDLFRDILALYAERVLPGGISAGFQSDSRTWALHHDPHRLMPLRLAHFDRFMGTLSSLPANGPFLLFFHHDLPHSPYWLSPDGVTRELSPHGFNLNMTGDPRTLEEILERYRQQVSFVDRNLGQIVDALKARGLYDNSIIIVLSDHGVSYRTEAPGRNLFERGGRVANADLLLSIPLFIKLPRQRQGHVSDRDVQLIDIVPTLAELLGMSVPWKVLGRDVFAEPGARRPKVAYDRRGHRYEFADDLGLRALEYRIGPVTVIPLASEARP